MSVSDSTVRALPRLYYILDPMCSWCYAFTRCWSELQRVLPEQVQIIHVLGGLAPDTTEPMPEETRKMIQHTWQKIETMVPGVRFNYDFWTCNTPIRSTYPACRAILAANKQKSTAGSEMLQAIQEAYYQHAKNPSLVETLQVCAETIGLNITQFTSDLSSENIDVELKHELTTAEKLRAFSFPSLRLIYEDKLYSVTIDYLNHQKMLNEINAVIGGS